MMRYAPIALAILLFAGAFKPGDDIACAQTVLRIPPPNPFPAQDEDFVRAEALELQKEYVSALEIYKRLYDRDGTDMLFWKMIMLYEQTGDYRGMADLVESRLDNQPDDLSLLRYLARAQFGLGNDDLARDALNRIIDDRWNEEQRVYMVASELEMHNDIEGIAALYATARDHTGNEDDYAAELGSAYTMLNRYPEAIEEYLKLIDLSPQTAGMMIRALLDDLKFSGLDNGKVTSALEEYLKGHPGSIEPAGLLSELLYDDGEIEKAYETLIEPAILAKAPDAVWEFALQAADDGHEATALRAFGDFYDHFTDDDRRNHALISAAEIRAKLGDTAGAARDYNRLIDSQPGAELAAVAMYRVIALNRETMSEEGYRTALSEFAGSTLYRTVAFAAYLELAAFVLQQGDFAASDDALMKAATKARTPDEQYELYRRIAFMNYYRADFAAMVTSIDQCMQYGAAEPDINDLLELRLLARRLISPNDSLYLAAIGRARFAFFREDRSAAVDSLKSVVTNAGPLLAPYAAMELAKLLSDDDPATAVEWYVKAASADADSTRRIAALMHAGDVAAISLGDDRAEELYLQALMESGGSVYDSEIRRKLRKVMGQ